MFGADRSLKSLKVDIRILNFCVVKNRNRISVTAYEDAIQCAGTYKNMSSICI